MKNFDIVYFLNKLAFINNRKMSIDINLVYDEKTNNYYLTVDRFFRETTKDGTIERFKKAKFTISEDDYLKLQSDSSIVERFFEKIPESSFDELEKTGKFEGETLFTPNTPFDYSVLEVFLSNPLPESEQTQQLTPKTYQLQLEQSESPEPSDQNLKSLIFVNANGSFSKLKEIDPKSFEIDQFLKQELGYDGITPEVHYTTSENKNQYLVTFTKGYIYYGKNQALKDDPDNLWIFDQKYDQDENGFRRFFEKKDDLFLERPYPHEIFQFSSNSVDSATKFRDFFDEDTDELLRGLILFQRNLNTNQFERITKVPFEFITNVDETYTFVLAKEIDGYFVTQDFKEFEIKDKIPANYVLGNRPVPLKYDGEIETFVLPVYFPKTAEFNIFVSFKYNMIYLKDGGSDFYAETSNLPKYFTPEAFSAFLKSTGIRLDSFENISDTNKKYRTEKIVNVEIYGHNWLCDKDNLLKMTQDGCAKYPIDTYSFQQIFLRGEKSTSQKGAEDYFVIPSPKVYKESSIYKATNSNMRKQYLGYLKSFFLLYKGSNYVELDFGTSKKILQRQVPFSDNMEYNLTKEVSSRISKITIASRKIEGGRNKYMNSQPEDFDQLSNTTETVGNYYVLKDTKPDTFSIAKCYQILKIDPKIKEGFSSSTCNLNNFELFQLLGVQYATNFDPSGYFKVDIPGLTIPKKRKLLDGFVYKIEDYPPGFFLYDPSNKFNYFATSVTPSVKNVREMLKVSEKFNIEEIIKDYSIPVISIKIYLITAKLDSLQTNCDVKKSLHIIDSSFIQKNTLKKDILQLKVDASEVEIPVLKFDLKEDIETVSKKGGFMARFRLCSDDDSLGNTLESNENQEMFGNDKDLNNVHWINGLMFEEEENSTKENSFSQPLFLILEKNYNTKTLIVPFSDHTSREIEQLENSYSKANRKFPGIQFYEIDPKYKPILLNKTS
jgi:hypothetical protein